MQQINSKNFQILLSNQYRIHWIYNKLYKKFEFINIIKIYNKYVWY